MLHISTGMTEYIAGEMVTVPVPAFFHYNSIVYRGTKIKEQVQIPVILGSGIKTPLDAAYLVENKYADLVSVGRGLLVDPEWVIKGQKYLQVTQCLRCKTCSYRKKGSNCPLAKAKKFKRPDY
jgi:2,4-dienoyl-CoA reductase-like NADH-dependent reductase (Old Yellow Enzyme family)